MSGPPPPGYWTNPQDPVLRENVIVGLSNNRVFVLGETQLLQWNTIYNGETNNGYTIALWQARNEHTQQGPFIYQGSAAGNITKNWTVSTLTFDLSVSNTFYFELSPINDPSRVYRTLPSHLFNITDPKSVTTSSSSAVSLTTRLSSSVTASSSSIAKVTSTSAVSSSTSTPSPTSTSFFELASGTSSPSPVPSAARGLGTGASAGIGVGVGVLAILAITAGISWYKRKGRRSWPATIAVRSELPGLPGQKSAGAEYWSPATTEVSPGGWGGLRGPPMSPISPVSPTELPG